MKTSYFKSALIVAAITATTVLSCSNGEAGNKENMTASDTITTASGLKVVFHERGEGTQAKAGDVVSVHYAGRLEDGTEFDNSFKRGEPISFPLGQGYVIKGWDEGIAMMKVGDSATLIIPPAIGYGDRDMGTIPPNSTLIFEVKLENVKEVKQPVPFDVEGKKIEKTPSGLQYIIVEKNEDGEQAYANMTAEVDYTLYLENGQVVDSSIPRGEAFKFVLGAGQVISGWDEGIRLMQVGDKMRMIVPPNLGYGDRGAGGVIPPGATLIFDVELISVTR